MKQQYQTRYEWLHESYQKWLTGFTRHAVSWGVCHPNTGAVEETHSACRIFFPASGNVRLNANRMIFESVILFFHHK